MIKKSFIFIRKVEEWSSKELKAMGCGAIAAVTQANREGSGPDCLLKLTYSPDKEKDDKESDKEIRSTPTLSQYYSSSSSSLFQEQRPVVLVGKGVCFDTGGINLKSAASMKTMKADMGGSAAALGLFWALSQAKVSFPMECWLILAENNINGNAYRPDDVITALNGDTIEIVHTDAEGRLLLADVLTAASRQTPSPLVREGKGGGGLSPSPSGAEVPKLLIDFATLTGTCITSLSNKYIGGFSNRDHFLPLINEAGRLSGERAWAFPCDADFEEDLKSDIADVLQCRQPVSSPLRRLFYFLFRLFFFYFYYTNFSSCKARYSFFFKLMEVFCTLLRRKRITSMLFLFSKDSCAPMFPGSILI